MKVWTVAIVFGDADRDSWISSFSTEDMADIFIAETMEKIRRYKIDDCARAVKDVSHIDSFSYSDWLDDEYGPDDVHVFRRFNLFGHDCLFTDERMDWRVSASADDYFYVYDMRHGDDDSIPLVLEEHVVVNHFGTILSPVELLPDGKPRNIADDDWGYCSDLPDCTMMEFMEEFWEKGERGK